MHPVYGDKYCTRSWEQHYVFSVKNLLVVKEVLLIRNDLVAVLLLSTTDAMMVAVDYEIL